jgi:RNase P subunit RPR2
MKKQKLKNKILFRYYKNLLEIYREILKKEDKYSKEIKEGLKEKIIILEKKLRFKFTKICYNCGSLDLKYRVKKQYAINICLKCGYQNFIKFKKD